MSLVSSFPLEAGELDGVSEEEILRVRAHCNRLMYQSILNCTKTSLNATKKRVCARGGSSFLFLEDVGKFAKIDKDWLKIMTKAAETQLVLPFTELEKCQKSLDGYLEQKRSKFPRFYFCSNPVLLQILSKGSDPQQVQIYYEKKLEPHPQTVRA